MSHVLQGLVTHIKANLLSAFFLDSRPSSYHPIKYAPLNSSLIEMWIKMSILDCVFCINKLLKRALSDSTQGLFEELHFVVVSSILSSNQRAMEDRGKQMSGTRCSIQKPFTEHENFIVLANS